MRAHTNTIDEKRLAQLQAQGLKNHTIAQRMGVTQGAIYHALRRIKARQAAPEAKP